MIPAKYHYVQFDILNVVTHEENHPLKIREGFCPDKFPPKHS